MKNISKIFNIRVFIYTFFIWFNLNISGIQNMYFAEGEKITVIIVKILHLFFMYAIFCKLHSLYKQRNTHKGKNEIIISLIYLVILMIFLVLIWPGAWADDDVKILKNAETYQFTPWQHFLTGLFYILCLQTIPIPAGLMIIQIIIAAFIVGYSVSNISILYGKNKKQERILQIILVLITLFPPLIIYILSGFRMGMYSYLELALITKLLILYKEQKKMTLNELLKISFLTIIISCWRTEGIYYPIFMLILYFILGKKVISRRVAIITFFIIMIINYLIGRMNNLMIKSTNEYLIMDNNNYSITATMQPVTSLIQVSSELDKEEIEKINKVLDVKYILENPDKSGEFYFWKEGVVKNYSEQEYYDYLKAYLKLAFKYPDVTFKSMWDIFFKAGSGFGEESKQTTKNIVANTASNALELYEVNTRCWRRWNTITSRVQKYKTAINIDVRNNVILFLNGSDINKNLNLIHNIFWNLFIPFTLILICLIYKLIKKEWFMIFLILSIIARIVIVFITAPAPYFMYYLSAYLCSYIISAIIIFEIARKITEKKIKDNKEVIKNEEPKEMLQKINSPEDVKKLTLKEKQELSEEIRKYIIEVVAENGGHLASNLGVVELTIALHSIFNVPEDKIIWDVGHQSYVHKIITGRREELKNIRKLNGIAGFPKTKENEADCFNTGHSSTSISAALGMARARDLQGKENNVIAVIGDGALTGGMALEALNDAGFSKSKMTVILNDNEMSISQNVGGLNKFLGKLRTKKLYTRTNNLIKKQMAKIPVIGNSTVKLIQKMKRAIKQMVIQRMFFEDIGFTYLGPVDGHNIEKLESILTMSKQVNGPVLIHVLTTKGKGYEIAEKNPDKFHATSPFDIETGESKKTKGKDYSKVFGDKLVELAKQNEKIVAVTASMKDGTGLTKFSQEFPYRFFDIGIAEQHAITMAAGMAKEGMISVVPIYSSFYQRAYDQVIHDVAMQNLPVIMCVDRAGIVGADGETHQGTLDMAFFRLVPNLTIMAPKDFKELEDMLEFAVNLRKPVVIRYPRGGEDTNIKFESHESINEGKAEILQKGKDVTIIAIGKMVAKAIKKANEIEKEGKSVEVINARFLKPLDEEIIKASIEKTKNVITIEDGTKINGLATAVKELIIDNNLKEISISSIAYPDEFIGHGSVEQLEELKLENDNFDNQHKK